MQQPKRKQNRLPAFDYSTVGAYFITICAKNRRPIFGRVVGGGVLDAPHLAPTPYGKIVAAQLEAMSHFYPDLQIEKSVVMPNHIHFIVSVTQDPSGASGTPPPYNHPVGAGDSGFCFNFQTVEQQNRPH